MLSGKSECVQDGGGENAEDVSTKRVSDESNHRVFGESEKGVICLEIENSLFMKMNEKLLSCSLQTTWSSDQVTDKLLKNNSLVYIGFAVSLDLAVLMWYSWECFELILLVSELQRNWKREREKVEGVGVSRENRTVIAPLIPLF